VRALGIDVGVGKGLDLVLMESGRTVADARARVRVDDLPSLLKALRPDVVAIDAPPSWAVRGRSRLTEREIRVFGIQSYGTPTGRHAADNSFYDWMRVGFRVFRAAEGAGYPRYGGGRARGTALEVFPHASAVVLAGCLPPAGLPKTSWRRDVLRSEGVDGKLGSADQVDAALAALTGLYALRGRSSALGDPKEGVIVLPATVLPARPYRRCEAPEPEERQPHLPRMSPCACGDPSCDRLTAREFAPGHDAKRKTRLWQLARAGDESVSELRRRGWELPPEMR